MNTLIVDSSVIVKWINQTNEANLEQADRIIDEALDGDLELLAPELAKYELGNVLIKKTLDLEDAITSLVSLYSLPITFIPESEDLAKITYELASSLRITYYDASFLSLAKQYNVTLITENIKHQGKESGIKVVSLKDY